MSTPERSIPHIRPGERVDSPATYNDRFDAITRGLQGVPPPRQVVRSAGVGVRVARFEIVSNAADYLVCRRLDAAGNAADDTVNVAKPPELRNSVAALGSATYSYTGTDARTATVGGDTESQVVVPPWTVGEEIRAEQGIEGGTGVSITTGDTAVALVWEARANGRAWAKAAS